MEVLGGISGGVFKGEAESPHQGIDCRGLRHRSLALRGSAAMQAAHGLRAMARSRLALPVRKYGSQTQGFPPEPKFIEEHDIEYWIYGHTHTQDGSGTVFPSKGKGTKLLCNQLGYVEYNEDMNGFQGDRIIRI